MAKLMVLFDLVILSLAGLVYGSGYSYRGAYPVIVGGYGGKGIGGYSGSGFGGGYSGGGGGGIGGILPLLFPLILLAILLPFIINLFRNTTIG